MAQVKVRVIGGQVTVTAETTTEPRLVTVAVGTWDCTRLILNHIAIDVASWGVGTQTRLKNRNNQI